MNDLQAYLEKNLPAYLDMLHEMVDINTFTANAVGVNRLAQHTAGLFSGLGFQAEFVPSTNPAFGSHLFLDRPAQGERAGTIALISHLDTVFPPEEEALNDFYWRVEGDRIYGPGTVDIKGGTVMIWAVLDALRAFAPQVFEQIHWLVCVDATEETLSDDFGKGIIARLAAGPVLACLVFEGGTPNPQGFPLVVSRKGRAEFRAIVEGRGAHAGNNHKLGANAILQLAHTVQQIASFTDYDQQITFNVGVISGGSVVNRVPHHAEAVIEMRAFDPQVFAAGVEKMLALNGSSQVSSADGFPCQVSLQVHTRNNPWPRNPGTLQLYDLWAAAAAGLGLAVLPEQRGGLSDGNLLWEHFPTLDGLGPSGNNAHCSERSPDGSKNQEFVVPSSFVPKALLNIAAIRRLVEAI
jgi:glutamate carboxypeptidase